MILLVPIKPEVPNKLDPHLWPALIIVLMLSVAFLEVQSILTSDSLYVEGLNLPPSTESRPELTEEAHKYLRHRPLNKIAPSRGDWDFPRLLFANFIHGSYFHLSLNLVGAFAGARICSTFLPFLCILSIFLLGGSLGLLTSLWVSSDLSEYVPHVGSSGGIFALMGTYYIYNFCYRTRYFFWFPSRHGIINLRTSWFFFLDVLLLELVLSASQLFPTRIDGVDHVAHVAGFLTGVLIAHFLRACQRWPRFLQTRVEYLFWQAIHRPREFDAVRTPLGVWFQLLDLNPYNDRIKLKVCRLLEKHCMQLTNSECEPFFRHLTPTFLDIHTEVAARLLKTFMADGKTIPTPWFMRTPYDSVIRMAKYLANPPEDLQYLYQLVLEYRKAHGESPNLERKLEFLLRKLDGFMPKPSTDNKNSTVG